MHIGEALKLYLKTFLGTAILTTFVYVIFMMVFDTSIANIVLLLSVILTFIVLGTATYITKSKLIDMVFLRGFFEGLTEATTLLVSISTIGTFSSIISIVMSIFFVLIVNDAINRFKDYDLK